MTTGPRGRKPNSDKMAMLAWRQLYETGRDIPEPKPALLAKATMGVAIVRGCESFPCANPADCACRGLPSVAIPAAIAAGTLSGAIEGSIELAQWKDCGENSAHAALSASIMEGP